MSEHELSESVESARDRLTALRVHVEREGAAPGASEVAGSLRDLQATLDKVHARYGLLCEILDRTKDVVFAKDREGRYTMINPQGADMFGKTMGEILGADDRALLPPADAERAMAVDREVMNSGETQTREETCAFLGVVRTLRTTTSAWYDATRHVRGVIGIAQDVTERRRSERDAATDRDRMRSATTEIVIGEERLRRTLAAELHNGLGQDIALAKMKLSMLRHSASVELRDPLSGIEQLVEQADRSLRSITYQISPPSLHDLGLVAALRWLAEDIAAKHGMQVRIEDDDSPSVADERIRAILFRAVRELLVNAATHAHVEEVVVHLTRQDGLVRIAVEDLGAGFDTADLERRGYGLFVIREQLKYVDGSMHVASTPGQGTTVILTAPAAESAARSGT
ncbi:MAG: PAS domain-containing protein [Planctomycetes bacterium]|nr:PAS domain-containing protein [Planctomycetota bacterium]